MLRRWWRFHRGLRERGLSFASRSLPETGLYLPDTEPWGRWEERFLSLLEGVDIALLEPADAVADYGTDLGASDTEA